MATNKSNKERTSSKQGSSVKQQGSIGSNKSDKSQQGSKGSDRSPRSSSGSKSSRDEFEE